VHVIGGGAAAATRTHFPYCAFGCGMLVAGNPRAPEIAGDAGFPVNAGLLCVKGFTAGATLGHVDRLTSPLVRNERGALEHRSWDEALDLVARRLRDVQSAHGKEAVGVFGSGSLTNEKAYLVGKLARVGLGTPHVDYNGRFCMSSAAAASTRAFGIDRGLPFPIEDVAGALILLAGANPAKTLPPMLRLLDAQRAPARNVSSSSRTTWCSRVCSGSRLR
jgi:assimilatory nitrate reductase catalytic subunit